MAQSQRSGRDSSCWMAKPVENLASLRVAASQMRTISVLDPAPVLGPPSTLDQASVPCGLWGGGGQEHWWSGSDPGVGRG